MISCRSMDRTATTRAKYSRAARRLRSARRCRPRRRTSSRCSPTIPCSGDRWADSASASAGGTTAPTRARSRARSIRWSIMVRQQRCSMRSCTTIRRFGALPSTARTSSAGSTRHGAQELRDAPTVPGGSSSVRSPENSSRGIAAHPDGDAL